MPEKISAIKTAYPKAKDAILNKYINDSICGTWEYLADAIFPGDSHALKTKGWQIIGAKKSEWSKKITPHMNVDHNASVSFCYFRETIRKLSETDPHACNSPVQNRCTPATEVKDIFVKDKVN